MANLKNLNFDSTDSLILPVGTTAQRDATNANLRYNSQTDLVETYQENAWRSSDGYITATVSGAVYTSDIEESGIPYRVHVFTGPGTFTPSYAGEIEYLLVGGGGGGSDNQYDDGAGGGAGGVLTGRTTVTPQGYSITVGAGGGRAGDGGNTTAFGLTAYKGGRGAGHRSDNAYRNGGTIGSGGGAGGAYGATDGIIDGQTQGGQGTGGQGRDGGTNIYRAYAGSGGGGFGSDGTSRGEGNGGAGGKGYFSTITGHPMWYAGGGGGYGYTTFGNGGLGGAGRGGQGASTVLNQLGAPNTGGGGGGGKTTTAGYEGKAGGSGIAVVRYRLNKQANGGAPNIVTQNLVLNLDAGDTRSYAYGSDSTNWYDTATGNYTAILNGNPSIWEGTYGGGFNYTKRGSQTADWMQLPHTSLPLLGNAYTIEYWIQPTNDGTRYWNHNTVAGGNESIHQISSNTIRHYNSGTGIQSFTNGEILQYTIVRYADGSGVTYKNGENPQSTSSLLDYTTAGIQGWVLNQEQDALLGGFDSGQNAFIVTYCLRTYSVPLGQRGIRQNFEAMRRRFGI